jgi:hypothetical protein
MRANDNVFSKITKGSRRLADSGLKLNQLIYALRTHIIPIAEYTLRNSICFQKSLNEVDQFSRNIIQDKIGGICIPKKSST